jgi:glycosyltransferase involved in cell wall biosynthesis
MMDANKPAIAVLICTTVIGGHEFQAAALVGGLRRHADVTVYVNDAAHVAMFAATGAPTVLLTGALLRPGPLPKQLLAGARARGALRRAIGTPGRILISAGAVEAGVAASIALHGLAPLTLYLPSFYDRVPVWGRVGHGYNWLLARCCGLYRQIVTINRVQARIIKAFTGVGTLVVPNLIRDIAPAPAARPGRLLFIGRLDAQKRVDELIKWADFVDNPFSEFLVIGDGPFRPALEALAAQTRHVKVAFAGWLSAPEQDMLIDRNDVLVLNSILEGEPLVIREANKRSLRVLARAITGVRGITRKSSRFDSEEAFQALLRRTPDWNPATPKPDDGDLRRRDRMLARLAQQLHEAPSVNKS